MKNQLFTLGLCFLSFASLAQSPTWNPLKGEGEVQERHENALVQVGEKLVLLGGRGQKQVDIFDLAQKKWKKGAQPPVEIHHLQAIQLDGLVYVLGALTGNWPHETPLSHILIYEPVEDFWAVGPKIPENRQRGAAGAAVYNNKIYLVNGIINGHSSGWVNWLDEYDPYTNSWKVLPNSPHARDHFHAVVVDDQLFVAGGRKSGSVENRGFAGTVAPTDIYDFKTGKWETHADIPTPRAGTAVGIINKQPVVLGGESDTQEAAHNEVEAFDLTSGSWKSLAPMNSGRHGTQAVSLNNHLIIGAGSGNRGGGPELKEFEILSLGNSSNLRSTPIKKGTLSASVSEVSFSSQNSSKEVEISNTNGNQALLITYLQLDSTENYELISPRKTPFLLAPNGSFSVKIKANGNHTATSAKLFVKAIGNSAPLEIKLTMN